MNRDYRRSPRRSYKRKAATSPPWIWTLVGLIAGLFVAFLVFLQMRPQKTVTSPPIAVEKPAKDHSPEPAEIRETHIPPPPKPRFDFYNLLPEMEVIVPEQEISGTPTHEGVKQVEQPGTYLLQAGSFRSRQQADQLRAKLALLGLETTLQAVSINSKQAWHRVRVGPFRNLQDLNEARTLLKKNGVDAILIRLKD